MKTATYYLTAYKTCWLCEGSGMGPRMNGDPDGNCWECKGDGVLRIRDEKGRFARSPVKMGEVA